MSLGFPMILLSSYQYESSDERLLCFTLNNCPLELYTRFVVVSPYLILTNRFPFTVGAEPLLSTIGFASSLFSLHEVKSNPIMARIVMFRNIFFMIVPYSFRIMPPGQDATFWFPIVLTGGRCWRRKCASWHPRCSCLYHRRTILPTS